MIGARIGGAVLIGVVYITYGWGSDRIISQENRSSSEVKQWRCFPGNLLRKLASGRQTDSN